MAVQRRYICWPSLEQRWQLKCRTSFSRCRVELRTLFCLHLHYIQMGLCDTELERGAWTQHNPAPGRSTTRHPTMP